MNDGAEIETHQARLARLKELGINGNGAGTPLAMRAQQWATPNTNDWTGSSQPGQRRGQLSEQTECPPGLPALATEPAGPPSSPGGRSSPLRLNPLFVEWLMGLPVGWTDFAPVATPWSRPRPLSPGASCGSA